MGPGQAGTWNKNGKPEDMATRVASNSKASAKGGVSSYKGVGSAGNKQPVDKSESNDSGPTTQTIGNGNVKRTGYKTPSADVSGADMMGGKGMGGY